MKFTEERILSAQADWRVASDCNEAMDILRLQRVQLITVSGDLQRSKLAWKFATLRQAVTYRLVDIGDAAIAQSEEGNALSSIILGRAFLETVALLHTIVRAMERSVAVCDLEQLDTFAMRVIFGGRHPDWRFGDNQAINVLSALDQLEAEFPLARDLYERVSEVVHPNSQGLHQFYAITDYEFGDVIFSREKRQASAVQYLLPLLSASALALGKLSRMDALVTQIADLHERSSRDIADQG